MPVSAIRFELASRLDDLHATPLIDGENLLLLGPPTLDRTPLTRETAADRRRPAPRFIPQTASALLPPDSAALLPLSAPRRTVVGICSCGAAQDRALRAVVRREAGHVVWEPSDDPDTIPARWTFDLVDYLDALDDAAQRVLERESRAARVARAVRAARDSPAGLSAPASDGRWAGVLDARAEAADVLSVFLGPREWTTVRCREDESEDEILQRVREGRWDR